MMVNAIINAAEPIVIPNSLLSDVIWTILVLFPSVNGYYGMI
jgi:hypothetical protein